jgi:hypothetical protein
MPAAGMGGRFIWSRFSLQRLVIPEIFILPALQREQQGRLIDF